MVDNVETACICPLYYAQCDRGHDFIGNREQVRYVGARDERWGVESGNHWANYLGWDRDGKAWATYPMKPTTWWVNQLALSEHEIVAGQPRSAGIAPGGPAISDPSRALGR